MHLSPLDRNVQEKWLCINGYVKTGRSSFEQHQSQLLKTNQSKQNVMRYKVTHHNPTSLSEEDLQQGSQNDVIHMMTW